MQRDQSGLSAQLLNPTRPILDLAGINLLKPLKDQCLDSTKLLF
jgi:hypothetical protein